MSIDTKAYIKAYARQQQILKYLGFYDGVIDGRWGPKTVAAKKAFERHQSFKPCIPNYGHPFAFHPPYPHGLYIDSTGLMHIRNVEDSLLPEEDKILVDSLAPSETKEKSAPVPLSTLNDIAPVAGTIYPSTQFRERDLMAKQASGSSSSPISAILSSKEPEADQELKIAAEAM